MKYALIMEKVEIPHKKKNYFRKKTLFHIAERCISGVARSVGVLFTGLKNDDASRDSVTCENKTSFTMGLFNLHFFEELAWELDIYAKITLRNYLQSKLYIVLYSLIDGFD